MDTSVLLAPFPAVEMAVHRHRLPAGTFVVSDLSHAHREFELHVVLEGTMSYKVGEGTYRLSRGCAILARPYEQHCLLHLSQEVCEHFWITLSTENDWFPPSLPLPKRGVVWLNETLLADLMSALDALSTQGEDPFLPSLVFWQLFRLLNAGEQQHVCDRVPDLPDDVIEALRYIDEHLAEDVRTTDIATACNVSVSTLERHFKTALNATPMTVLRKKRLVASLKRLAMGDSVAEAAVNSGFSDYSHYVQLFKKQYGITPLQYKKNNLKK
ncbi:MAG: helix-turn-helix transcriptional regulator [Clostridia bacterium]|nr:helix-turn-helix transcriptional regulator [Clostridia bacterium]